MDERRPPSTPFFFPKKIMSELMSALRPDAAKKRELAAKVDEAQRALKRKRESEKRAQKEAEEEPTGGRDLSEVQRQVEENTSAATAPPVAASPRVVRSQRRRPELLLDAESTANGDSLRVMESVKEALHEEVTQLEDATPEEAEAKVKLVWTNNLSEPEE